MNIQKALEKSLEPLGGEIVSIDMLANVVVSRKIIEGDEYAPSCNVGRYMVHTFGVMQDNYGKIFWGHYDLSPAQAMDSMVEKIQRATRWQNTDETIQALGSDQVTLKPCELFATPDSIEAMTDYLEKFSGSEAVAANTCAYMMWNLAAKLTNPETQEVK